MGMPAFVCRWWFGAAGVENLRRGILGFIGIRPVRETLIGSAESLGAAGRQRWIEQLAELGRQAK